MSMSPKLRKAFRILNSALSFAFPGVTYGAAFIIASSPTVGASIIVSQPALLSWIIFMLALGFTYAIIKDLLEKDVIDVKAEFVVDERDVYANRT